MADHWFDIASPNHFWIRRRFEVLQHLGRPILTNAKKVAEVGCGHGLLQSQIEEAYSKPVTGFDLNELALGQNLSRLSPVCCYNIYERQPQFKGQFDTVLLFDVLEHIDDEDGFLQASLFHLAPGGSLILNVPAGQWAFSAYDRAAGHKRRYSVGRIAQVAERNHLQITAWTYWGLPLLAPLLVRSLSVIGKRDEDQIIAKGFDTRNGTVNRWLSRLSKCEFLPQRLIGTSLMTVLQAKHR